MSATRDTREDSVPVEERESITVRFCGDSGDGMQVIGAQLTQASARMGNSVSSLPDFPAEIRAPAGTLAGVSGFQVHFSSQTVPVPADKLNALVVMNPAALQANWKDLEPHGVLVANSDAFTPEECAKAGYQSNPLADGALDGFRLVAVPLDQLNREAVAKLNLTPREADRCRNFFVLGIMCWLYDRAIDPICHWLESRFAANPAARKGNVKALKAGYLHAENARLFTTRYAVPKARLPAGRYRYVTGTDALVFGLQAAAHRAQRHMVFACSAMMPATEILHAIQTRTLSDVSAVQAENDGAAAGMALGAAYGGAIGVTATSGSGMCSMSETIGLAVMTELPLVIVNVQRGGPSTGLPTKTEQADLLQSLYGRNGECPLPVLAPSSPSDCFFIAYEAVRIACRYMTPVVILSDLFLASGIEPWRLPDPGILPEIQITQLQTMASFMPYQRDERLARPWAHPGTAGAEHRIGGLEKEDGAGNVSYDAANHEAMVEQRAAKIAGIVRETPDLVVDGPPTGDVLVLGWGSTQGAIIGAVEHARRSGWKIARAHLRHLNPLPANTGEVLRRYRRVLAPELNRGQLSQLLRAAYLTEVVSVSKLQGRPFQVRDIVAAIEANSTGDGVR